MNCRLEKRGTYHRQYDDHADALAPKSLTYLTSAQKTDMMRRIKSFGAIMAVVLDYVIVTVTVFKQTPLTRPETMFATGAVWMGLKENLQRQRYDNP
jgi:hypothetical protein